MKWDLCFFWPICHSLPAILSPGLWGFCLVCHLDPGSLALRHCCGRAVILHYVCLPASLDSMRFSPAMTRKDAPRCVLIQCAFKACSPRVETSPWVFGICTCWVPQHHWQLSDAALSGVFVTLSQSQLFWAWFPWQGNEFCFLNLICIPSMLRNKRAIQKF